MIIRKFLNSQKTIFFFLLIVAFYFFICFLPMPGAIHVGLDPSWSYVISYASFMNLNYGKDIIFTYGPLGYLIHGATIEGNFWQIFIFRLLIHLIFYVVIVQELVRNYLDKKFTDLIFLTLSVFGFLLLSGSTDYKILFIFMALIVYEDSLTKKSKFFYSLFLGIIAGFCLTTKFSLGILTTGTAILYYGGNLVAKVKNNIKISTQYCYKLLIFLISSLLTASLILETLSEDRSSLIAYIRNSLELSSGYSSAMSIVGSNWEVLYSLFQAFFILTILIAGLKAKPNVLGYNLSLLFVLWIVFKHGFVRQDGHVLVFISFTPLLAYLCLKNSLKSGNKRWIFYFTQISSLLISITTTYLLFYSPFAYSPFAKVLQNYKIIAPQTLSIHNFSNNLKFIFNPQKEKERITDLGQTNLFKVRLQPAVLDIIGSKSVDVIPWEISLVPANGLNWKPRPIFQAYSAYTNKLDSINTEGILNNETDYILYDFTAIDNRHPFFDEPKTFFEIFCRYQISPDIPDFIETEFVKKIMILEKRSFNICSQSEASSNFSVDWDQNYDLGKIDKELVRANLQIEYSILGKIYKTIFRSPPVTIHLTYRDEQESSFRIIPENANNGVIISHLPKSPDEALSLFQGDLPIPVKSFRISNENSWLYKSQIEGSFSSYHFLDPAIKQKKAFTDELQLSEKYKSIKFLPQITQEYNGVMDTSLEASSVKSFQKGDNIFVNGWAFHQESEKLPEIPILITFDSSDSSNSYLGITQTGNYRPDVADFFKQSSYYNSGWSISLRSEKLPKGIHKIRAWIYEQETNTAIPLNGLYKIEISN